MTDPGTFEAFVLEFQDLVYGTALRLLGHPAEAEDVAQSVFLKAFERADDVVSHPAAPGWLKTVTTNECLNHLGRYRRRWRFFSEMDEPDGSGDSGVDRVADATIQDPVERLSDGERRAALEAALRALPPHQRVSIVLFHFDDMSYEAIASRLQITVAKVKSDIHRGRRALRTALEGAAHGASVQPSGGAR